MDYKTFNRAWLTLCIGNSRPQIIMHPDTFQAEWRKFSNYLQPKPIVQNPLMPELGVVQNPDLPPMTSFKGVEITFDKNILHGVVRLEQIWIQRDLPFGAYRKTDGPPPVPQPMDAQKARIDLSIMPIGVESFEWAFCQDPSCGGPARLPGVLGVVENPTAMVKPRARQAIWKLKDDKYAVRAEMDFKTVVTTQGIRMEPGQLTLAKSPQFLCQCCFHGNYEAYERVNAAGAKFGELEVWEDLSEYSKFKKEVEKFPVTYEGQGRTFERDGRCSYYRVALDLRGLHLGPPISVLVINPRFGEGVSQDDESVYWDRIVVCNHGIPDAELKAGEEPELKTEQGWLEDAYWDGIREQLKRLLREG